MRGVVATVRQQQPDRIVIAVPTAASSTYEEFAAEVDELVSLIRPEAFFAVGFWYENFSQTSDEEVRDLLQQATPEQLTTPPKRRKMPGAGGHENRATAPAATRPKTHR